MKTLMSFIVALVLLGSTLAWTLHAQDINGDWQRTLKAAKDLRLIARISKQLDGSLQLRILAA